jgi:hypothetical protein
VRIPSQILAVCLLVATATVTACGTTTTPSPTTAPDSTLPPPLSGQTDTDWGRIWDTVPADFPTYPGSTVSEEAANGPASATLVVDGDVANEAATWMDEQVLLDGYAIESLSGPLEDGSYIFEAEREGGCRVQVTAAPLGSLTTITIMYGASCPNT